jgi:hypothetical protein
MRRNQLAICLAVLVCALALACGSDGGSDDSQDVTTAEDAAGTADATQTDDDATEPEGDVTADTQPSEDVETPKDVGPPAPFLCEEAVPGFEACGGEVKGLWDVVEYCVDFEAVFENPFGEMCPESTIEGQFNMAGVFTFDDTTITSDFTTQEVAITMTIPNECLTDLSLTCETIGEGDEGPELDCVTEGEFCVCSALHSDAPEDPEVSDYVIDGNNMVITDADGTVETIPYCVIGDRVVVEITDVDDETGKESINYMLLEKQ